ARESTRCHLDECALRSRDGAIHQYPRRQQRLAKTPSAAVIISPIARHHRNTPEGTYTLSAWHRRAILIRTAPLIQARDGYHGQSRRKRGRHSAVSSRRPGNSARPCSSRGLASGMLPPPRDRGRISIGDSRLESCANRVVLDDAGDVLDRGREEVAVLDVAEFVAVRQATLDGTNIPLTVGIDIGLDELAGGGGGFGAVHFGSPLLDDANLASHKWECK